MKKTFVFIFCIINIIFSTNAQNVYYNNFYNFYTNNIAGLSIVKEDTTFVVASYAQDSTNYSRINFSRFTLDGNLISQKNYGADLRDYYPGRPGSLQKLSDGNFIIAGAVVDPIYTNAFLLKVNQNFDSIVFKEFVDSVGSNHYEEFEQCKETQDKGYILGGAIQSGSHTDALLIIKIDSSGNLVFKKTYSLIGIDYVRDLIETPDKGFLLGCYSWDYYNAAYSGDPWGMKLDSLGNYEWSKKFGGPNQDGAAHVAIDKDSNYIIAYSYAYFTQPGNASYNKIEVVKIDKNGSVIWDKQYDTISAGYPNMVKTLNNGDIIVIGKRDYWDGINFYFTSWILKLKPNGDSIFYRFFHKFNDSHTNDNTANDFCILNDNSIIVCGDVQQDTMYQSLWLVKIDSNGCLQPGCNNVGIEEIKYQKQESLNVYPNPAQDYFIVEYDITDKLSQAVVEINDITGHKIQDVLLNTNKGQKLINTKQFAKGIYICCLKNNGKNIGQSKVVIK